MWQNLSLSFYLFLSPIKFGTGATGATPRRHDDRTRRRRYQAPALRACHPEGVRGHCGATGVPPWGKHGPGGVRCRYFSPPGWQVTRVPACVRRPFLSPRRTGRYWKEMISARLSHQGVRRWVWDPKTFVPGQKPKVEARPTSRTVSMERPGDWDGLMEV